MHTEEIEYEAGDLHSIGHLAVDDTSDARRPAILVCHEGPGLGAHVRRATDRLAELGYVAFALDYHGGAKTLQGPALFERMGPLRQDNDQIRLLARAGLDVLLAQPTADPSRVAAIGYCFGGTMALELARSGADLKAVVGFHSGLTTSKPEDAKNIAGRVLVQIGADDGMIPPEQRLGFEEEMRAGGVDWQMIVHGGAVHSFTNPDAADMGMPGVKYGERADRRSWQAMVDLFTETFG